MEYWDKDGMMPIIQDHSRHGSRSQMDQIVTQKGWNPIRCLALQRRTWRQTSVVGTRSESGSEATISRMGRQMSRSFRNKQSTTGVLKAHSRWGWPRGSLCLESMTLFRPNRDSWVLPLSTTCLQHLCKVGYMFPQVFLQSISSLWLGSKFQKNWSKTDKMKIWGLYPKPWIKFWKQRWCQCKSRMFCIMYLSFLSWMPGVGLEVPGKGQGYRYLVSVAE